MMTDKRNRHKLNNKGSAIVTVLIVIIFISILATTVLYLAGRNMKLKATDRFTKESFYETEQTMEEIKAGLVRIASLSYDDAYKAVISEYAGYNDSGRKNLFNNTFMKAFSDRYSALAGGCKDLATSGYAVTSAGSFTPFDPANPVNQLLITGVEVKDTKNDYTTIIRTDFLIVCPDVFFNVNEDTSVPDAPGTGTKININDCVLYTNWEKR